MTPEQILIDEYQIDIYIAGDWQVAKNALRQFCTSKGFCVSVQEILYIYKYGEEFGIKVTPINYPRFPKTKKELWGLAQQIGELLQDALCQGSFLLQASDRVEWFSRREDKF